MQNASAAGVLAARLPAPSVSIPAAQSARSSAAFTDNAPRAARPAKAHSCGVSVALTPPQRIPGTATTPTRSTSAAAEADASAPPTVQVTLQTAAATTTPDANR